MDKTMTTAGQRSLIPGLSKKKPLLTLFYPSAEPLCFADLQMLLPYHRPYTGQTGEQTGPFQDSMVTDNGYCLI